MKRTSFRLFIRTNYKQKNGFYLNTFEKCLNKVLSLLFIKNVLLDKKTYTASILDKNKRKHKN